MTHLFALPLISKPTSSVPAMIVCTGQGGPREAGRGGGRRAGRKWNRYFVDFLFFLFCLHPGRNLPDLYKCMTQFVPFVRQREPWGPRYLWHGAGEAMARKHIHDHLLVGSRKQGGGRGYRTPPKESECELSGRLWKKFFCFVFLKGKKKNVICKIILIYVKKGRALWPTSNCMSWLPFVLFCNFIFLV